MNPFTNTYTNDMIENAAAILEGKTPAERKQFLRDRIQSLRDHITKNKEKLRDASLPNEEKSRLKFQIDAMTKEIAWLNSKLNAPTV